MTKFIKAGKNIRVKPQGFDYDLINGQVYDLAWDNWNGTYIFSEDGNLNLPKKVYELKKDASFKKRVLTAFEKSKNQTTGVMLAGDKGTGKTILAKVIAKESNLPIIVVNSEYPAAKLNMFFKEFDTPVCIIFDEIEKNWNTEKMLEFLDGVQATAKKLVLMTCNSIDNVSQYMKDRCSRVRYLRRYSSNDNLELISTLVADSGIAKEKVEETTAFIISNIKYLSIDNVLSFLSEVLFMEDEDFSLEEILEDMNISSRKQKQAEPLEKRMANELSVITGGNVDEILKSIISDMKNSGELEDCEDSNEYSDDDDDDNEKVVCCDCEEDSEF